MSDPYAPTAPGLRASKRKRSKKALIAVCAVVAALGLGGMAVGAFSVGRDTSIVDQLMGKMTVRGSVTLELEDMLNWGTACAGREPYDYLEIGAPVEITDAEGKTVGLGRIEDAKEVNTRCVMAFRIEGVPNDSAFYKVAIGGHSAGKFTAAEMKEQVNLTIG